MFIILKTKGVENEFLFWENKNGNLLNETLTCIIAFKKQSYSPESLLSPGPRVSDPLRLPNVMSVDKTLRSSSSSKCTLWLVVKARFFCACNVSENSRQTKSYSKGSCQSLNNPKSCNALVMFFGDSEIL